MAEQKTKRVTMIIVCLAGGCASYFLIKKAEKNKYKEKNAPDATIATVNEFINVKDIYGNFLQAARASQG